MSDHPGLAPRPPAVLHPFPLRRVRDGSRDQRAPAGARSVDRGATGPERVTGAQACKAAALVFTPSLVFLVALLLTGGIDDRLAAADPRCDSADRAAVVRIRDVVAQPDLHSTRRLERGVSDLAAARTDCAIGAVERGLAAYAALDLALR